MTLGMGRLLWIKPGNREVRDWWRAKKQIQGTLIMSIQAVARVYKENETAAPWLSSIMFRAVPQPETSKIFQLAFFEVARLLTLIYQIYIHRPLLDYSWVTSIKLYPCKSRKVPTLTFVIPVRCGRHICWFQRERRIREIKSWIGMQWNNTLPKATRRANYLIYRSSSPVNLHRRTNVNSQQYKSTTISRYQKLSATDAMSSASNNPPSLYSKSASLKLSYLPPVLLLEARITPLVSITVLAYLVIQNLVGSNNTDFSIIQVPDPTKLAHAARHWKVFSSIRSLAPAPLKANVNWPWHSHSMQRSQLYMAHRLPFKLSTTWLAWAAAKCIYHLQVLVWRCRRG